MRALAATVQNLEQHLLSRSAEQSDADLVRRFALERDEAAFGAIVQRFGPIVFGVCRRVLCHQQDAEDAFQATFLVLARHAASVQRAAKIGNWLYGVAFNVARKARAMREKREANERIAAARRDEARTELSHDLRESLDAELHALPARYRSAIVLCDLLGRTMREAANEMKCSPKTLGTWLLRGRTLLARRLIRRGLAPATALIAAAAAPASLIAAAVARATGKSPIPTTIEMLTKGTVNTMFAKATLYCGLAFVAVGIGAGLSQGPSFFAAHASSTPGGERSDAESRRPLRAADPLQAVHNFFRAWHDYLFSVDDKKDEKPKFNGTWEKKDGEPRIEFAGKDELKISPHNKDEVILVVCSYTRDKNGLVKAKITALEGTAKDKAAERIPVGTEFSFQWKVKDDSATLDDVTGEKFEPFKSILEGEFKKK